MSYPLRPPRPGRNPTSAVFGGDEHQHPASRAATPPPVAQAADDRGVAQPTVYACGFCAVVSLVCLFAGGATAAPPGRQRGPGSRSGSGRQKARVFSEPVC